MEYISQFKGHSSQEYNWYLFSFNLRECGVTIGSYLQGRAV